MVIVVNVDAILSEKEMFFSSRQKELFKIPDISNRVYYICELITKGDFDIQDENDKAFLENIYSSRWKNINLYANEIDREFLDIYKVVHYEYLKINK